MNKDYSYLNVDEFHIAYRSLSNTDVAKIITVSHYYCLKYRLSMAAEDISQEALIRVYAGARNIPKEIAVVNGLIHVIKSVSYEFFISKANKQQQLEEQRLNFEGTLDINLYIDNSIEKKLIAEQAEVLANSRWQALLVAFNADHETCQLLAAIEKENKAKDIVTNVFNGNQTKYHTTRKRLMRTAVKMLAEKRIQ